MKNSRDIAAAIDLRVRQLAVHRLSDSALIDQMVGYMGDLQRLWTLTTDQELAALCDEFPGFVRYATLMESVSEALRCGAGVPASVKQLPPLPEPIKRKVENLLSDGAALERALQQKIDASHAERFRSRTVQAPQYTIADLDVPCGQWHAAAQQLIADLAEFDAPEQAQQLIRHALQEMATRIEQLRGRA
jgi:hypothetical protein